MNNRGILIAAPSSGSGKTTITCGILSALKRRGINAVSFKCGPDFIDPLFHERVLGVPSYNLDLFLAGGDSVKRTYAAAAKDADITVTEGVMGYYDGLSASSDFASAYHTANVIKVPVILVVNARGKALSAIAEIQGFMNFRPNSRIAGVIFNQMSEGVYNSLKDEVKNLGITPLGYLPKTDGIVIESRHLGLTTPQDIADIDKRLRTLADMLEKTVDFDALLEIAESAEDISVPERPAESERYSVNIAVAKDEAFCFLYRDNIALLERYGARVQYFSPLYDKALPDATDGLILPGGYPEIYAKQLSENKAMLRAIKESVQNGMPTLAECGGFMYLHSNMEGMNKEFYPMCGVIGGRAYRTEKLQRFGYVILTANADNPYLKGGELRAHEFHYFDSDEDMTACTAKKPLSERAWECMIARGNLFAGFPHIYYDSNREFIKNFLSRCEGR